MSPKRRPSRTPAHKKVKGECVIPGAIPLEALEPYVVKPQGTEADRIRSYVEWQAPDEKVRHLEKVATESIFGQQMDAWDVRTNKNRWWVITNPTNFYLQRLFPSLDYTLSFHVGVTTRMTQAEMCSEQEEMHDNINQLWNRLAHARSTLFDAQKTEEFQSVGMKCRECLLLLVRALSENMSLPAKRTRPQTGNFIEWCEVIAEVAAAGGSNERLRSHLKATSQSTWQFVNWLTHAQKADRHVASVAVDATENVLTSFLTSWARFKGKAE